MNSDAYQMPWTIYCDGIIVNAYIIKISYFYVRNVLIFKFALYNDVIYMFIIKLLYVSYK